MSFLPRFGFGKDKEAEVLQQRVSALQNAPKQCAEVAGRWTEFRRSVTVAIAVFMLAVGFALGVYREPIILSVAGLAQAIGLASPPPNADAVYAAYQHGEYATALQLAGPLAAQGDARAQSMLGLVYYRGRGVPQDLNEAVRWFRRAADQRDAAAQFYLGVMYSEGQGVPQDHDEAVEWYRRAADQGDAQAQYNLGLLYAYGEARGPDNISAYVWFNLAAARFAASDARRSVAVSSRDAVARKMAPDQIAEAQKLSREWKPQ